VKLHPFHPISVHLPVACLVLAPLADFGASPTQRTELWAVSAYLTAGVVVFGLIAAMFGALDFERAFSKAPKTVSWHAILMVAAVASAAVSAFGRFDEAFAVLLPPAPWAIWASVIALGIGGTGAAFGGELVYRHGVNVERD
jgi:uncharacterized membrane protein